MRRRMPALLLVLGVWVVSGTARTSSLLLERIYELKADEGVFAYSRISPSGRFLAYTSQARHGQSRRQIVKVIDLRSKAVVFSEPGLDAYWSTDERRVMFRSAWTAKHQVAIWHTGTDKVVRNIAPIDLGDYYSLGFRDGKDIVLTIKGFYYALDGDKAMLPARRIPPCPAIGTGERPLLSKDGRQVTTFVRGTIHVRSLTSCDYVFDTQVAGAKADFSWDGRFIAFHAPKADATGYEIRVIDIQARVMRTVTTLPGSSLFPSWSRSGDLYFRYDGPEYRGIMRLVDPLAAMAHPLPPRRGDRVSEWTSFFPRTKRPVNRISLVLVWAPWSAHSPKALQSLQLAWEILRRRGVSVDVRTASDIRGASSEGFQMLGEYSPDLAYITDVSSVELALETANQMPTYLLFRDGRLADRKLGAHDADEIIRWMRVAR